jgi:hypothetical protein
MSKQIHFKTVVFTVNLILILITAIFPYVHDGRLKWQVLNHFNLAAEMHLSTWWAGGVFLICGLLAFQLYSLDVRSKHIWLILAGIFTFFSFDELGSIHERIGNLESGMVILGGMAALLGSGLVYALLNLWRQKQDLHRILLLLLGFALIVSAAPNEYLEHQTEWPNFLIGPRLGFEEGLELMGAWICMHSLIGFRGSHNKQEILSGTAPILARIGKIKTLLAGGFLLNIVLAWITVRAIEVGPRGNPAVWYFTAVFILLGSIFLSAANNERRPEYGLAGGLFLLISMASVYVLNPYNTSILQYQWVSANSIVTFGAVLLMTTALYLWMTRRVSVQNGVIFAILTVALLSREFSNNEFVAYVIDSFFAFKVAIEFLPNLQARSEHEGGQTLAVFPADIAEGG